MNVNTTPSRDTWIDRIGREVTALRAREYACELLQDRSNAYVIVNVERDTREGPQTVKIYFQLDRAFPLIRPVMVVTILTTENDQDDEVAEWQLQIDSSTRLAWDPRQSHLYDIVMDVEKGIHAEHLVLAEQLPQSGWQEMFAEPLGPAESDMLKQTNQVDAPIEPPRTARRAFTFSRVALIGLALAGLLVLLAALAAMYVLPVRDTCAADWQAAQRDLGSNELATVNQAVQLLENLKNRSQNGERGASCQLANGANVLRDAYLRAGALALALENSDAARQAYAKAQELDGTSVVAKAGLQDALAMMLRPTWVEANTLSQASPPVNWSEVVTDLLKIQRDDPQAVNPGTNVTVTLSLYDTYIKWGDQLYRQGQPIAARDQYQAALKIQPNDAVAIDRQKWTDLSQSMQQPSITEWPQVIEQLKQRSTNATNTIDPAGQPIDALLYTAYIRYGQALLDLKGDVGPLVLEQSKQAQLLQVTSTDAGQAARDLQAAAEKLLSAGGTLGVQEPQKLDPKAWADKLKQLGLPETKDDKLVNVIVISNDRRIILTITQADRKEPRAVVLDDQGIGFDAIDGKAAIIKFTKDNQIDEAALDLSGGATYLVTIESQQPA